MKKTILCIAVSLLTLIITACSSAPDSDELSGFDEYKELVNEKLGYDASTISHVKARQAETGALISGTDSKVILFERQYDFDCRQNTPAIVVVSDSDIVCEAFIIDSLFSEFSLADIDGDGYEEILMHHHTSGNGGFSSHDTAVYKLEVDKLIKLFSYPTEDYSDYYGDYKRPDFDTGFTLTLSDGWTHTIENKYTGFSLTFQRITRGEYPYFDEQGNITDYKENTDEVLGVDHSLYIFKPIDVDGDGVFEILTAQYTSLWGRADGIGSAYTILKWNTNNSTMEVVKAGFWVYEDEHDDEAFRKLWQDYEDSWYL
jgi:hypothetical protein